MGLIEPQRFIRHNLAQQRTVARHRVRIVPDMGGDIKAVKWRNAHTCLTMNMRGSGGGECVDVARAFPIGCDGIFQHRWLYEFIRRMNTAQH